MLYNLIEIKNFGCGSTFQESSLSKQQYILKECVGKGSGSAEAPVVSVLLDKR